jgi:hypothetical protein
MEFVTHPPGMTYSCRVVGAGATDAFPRWPRRFTPARHSGRLVVSPLNHREHDTALAEFCRRHSYRGWSPRQGPNLLVAAYATADTIVFEWGTTHPFNYDFFIVRWSVYNGMPIPPNAQDDVPQNAPGRTRTAGFFHVPLPLDVIGSDGKRVGVSFIVEGCDGGLGSSNCRQGWTCPIQCRL